MLTKKSWIYFAGAGALLLASGFIFSGSEQKNEAKDTQLAVPKTNLVAVKPAANLLPNDFTSAEPVAVEEAILEKNLVTQKAPANHDTLILENIKKLQEMMGNMEQRIASLEDDMSNAQFGSNPQPNLEQQAFLDSTQNDNSGEENTIQSMVDRAQREQLYNNFEQAVGNEVDEQMSSMIKDNLSNQIAGREEWQKVASVQSSSCNASYCKVVVRIEDSIDDLTAIEIDGMIGMATIDYPNAIIRNQNNGDGTTDMIVYSTKKGVPIPSLTN